MNKILLILICIMLLFFLIVFLIAFITVIREVKDEWINYKILSRKLEKDNEWIKYQLKCMEEKFKYEMKDRKE